MDLFPGGKKIRSKVILDIGSLFKIDYKTLIVYRGSGRMYSCLFINS